MASNNRHEFGTRLFTKHWSQQDLSKATAICVYTSSPKTTTDALLYVDNVIVASNSGELIKSCKTELNQKFTIQNMGNIKNYLGLQITKKGDFIDISQPGYVDKLLNDFGLSNATESDIPMTMSYAKAKEDTVLLPNIVNYRKFIGSLLYLCVKTRLDIAASVNTLAQKVEKTNQKDLTEAKRVLQYLKSTEYLALRLGKVKDGHLFVGYAGANWAENRDDRRSNSGNIFFLFGSLISWSCRKQTCVALSSTEAEFILLSKEIKCLYD